MAPGISRGFKLLPVAVLAMVALLPLANAADYQVPFDLQISILLKVLVYDRTLAVRSRDGMVLGVVFDPKSASSRSCKDDFLKAYNASSRVVAGKTMSAQETPEPDLEKQADAGLKVLYLCNLADIDPVLDTAHRKQLISFAADESVVKAGAAIGLVPRDGKPKLLVNVNASIASGMQLDPQLMRLAEPVRGR